VPACPSARDTGYERSLFLQRWNGYIIVKFNLTLGGLQYSEILMLLSCSARWNLGTNSAFALGPRKPTENLHYVVRSQDVPMQTDF
jgi:hypothetical protein